MQRDLLKKKTLTLQKQKWQWLQLPLFTSVGSECPWSNSVKVNRASFHHKPVTMTCPFLDFWQRTLKNSLKSTFRGPQKHLTTKVQVFPRKPSARLNYWWKSHFSELLGKVYFRVLVKFVARELDKLEITVQLDITELSV